MSGYAGGYAISPFPTGPGVGTEATDKAVLYWDGVNNLVKGSADFIFNDTLKQLVLGTGSQLLLPDGTAAAPALAWSGFPSSGLMRAGADTYVVRNGVIRAGLNGLNWAATGFDIGFTADVLLARDAAGVLAQRNGTNAQELKIYDTYTDDSNWQGLRIGYKAFADQAHILSTYSGTGTAQLLALGTDGNAALYFRTNGSSRWVVWSNGMLLPNADATYDLGSLTTRVRAGYFGGVATTIPITIKAHASQTANLQEWQNSSGTALAYVGKDGVFKSSGLVQPVDSKTANYTATRNDHVVKCNASGGAFTITLPAAASNAGMLLHIKKTDSSANRITIDGNASELVEDATTQQLIYQGENLMLQCDGTQWWVL